jgi:hypothetical protein
MEQSPSEADDTRPANQIPHILWNLKVHYHLHRFLPMVTILSQMNPGHTHPPYFLNIHLNIILPSTPSSSNGLFPSGLGKVALWFLTQRNSAKYFSNSKHIVIVSQKNG